MSIVSSAISGFKWTAGARMAGQLFNWMITIVVIRQLEPQDYGVFAVALVVTTFITLFSEFGIGNGLIRKKDFSVGMLRKAFGYILIINIGLCGLLYLCAPYVAEFYEKEQLADILQVQSCKFLLIALFVIPNAKLRHKMRFKRLSLNDLCAVMVGGITTLFLALNGFGVWSLVLGNLSRLAILAVLTQIAEPTILLPNFDIRDLNGIGSFGFVLLLNRMVFFFYTKADILLMSKVLSTDMVGFYTVAKDLATLPMAKIASSINIVGFSAFSKYEGNTGELSGYYLKAVASLAFISFPVFFGISSVAPEIVALALGENWLESTLILQIIVLSVPFRVMNIVNSALLEGAGSVVMNLKNSVLALAIFVPLFAYALQWGGVGVASVWAVIMPAYFSYVVWTLKRHLKFTLIDVYKSLFWPFIASLVMILLVRLLSVFLEGYETNTLLILFAEMALGAIVYLGINIIFNREYSSHFFSLVLRRSE